MESEIKDIVSFAEFANAENELVHYKIKQENGVLAEVSVWWEFASIYRVYNPENNEEEWQLETPNTMTAGTLRFCLCLMGMMIEAGREVFIDG